MKPVPALQQNIPALAELMQRRQWVCWRAVERDGKLTKIPVQPTGINASTTNPHTWADYTSCAAVNGSSGIAGCGFVFTRDAGIVGVDIDGCRDPTTGEIDAEAQAIVDRLRSYTEISQSGRGLHILCRGTLTVDGGRHGRIEVYWHGRYFVMTGNHLAGTPDEIEEAQEALDWLWATKVRPGVRLEEPTKAEPIAKGAFPWAKFRALLENDATFKRTWERKRGSEWKGDDSLSRYDLALAVRAAMVEWEDGEISALIWAFREKEGETKKLERTDYLSKFVIGRAREMLRRGQTDRDMAAAMEDEARDEAKGSTDAARRAVQDRLGVDIERFVQVGKDPATYFAVIEGREVRIGNENDLLQQGRVRSRLMSEAGVIIQLCNQMQWDTVVRCLLAMREQRAVEDGDFSGRIANLVETYLTARKPIPIAMLDGTTRDKGDVILKREPFIENGKIYVSAPDIVTRIAHLPDFKGATEVRAWLAMAGYVAGDVVAHHSIMRKSLCRSYWSRLLQDDPHAI